MFLSNLTLQWADLIVPSQTQKTDLSIHTDLALSRVARLCHILSTLLICNASFKADTMQAALYCCCQCITTYYMIHHKDLADRRRHNINYI